MVLWIRKNINAIAMFLGAVALALKPVFLGTSAYGITGWVSVAILVAAAAQTYIAPNIEGQDGIWVKDGIAILAAALAAVLNVAPNGFSRQDIWTVASVVVAVAIPMFLPTLQPKAILPTSGTGQMSDGHRA